MRAILLFSFVLLLATPDAYSQAPAQPARPAQPATGAPAPAAPRPAQPRRAAQPAARAGIAITITDPAGVTLSGINVEVLGASDRAGQTNASGQINFPGLQAGTYRLRFSGDTVIAFEREITLRAAQVAAVDVTLNPAPDAPEAPAPPPPPAAPAVEIGPVGEPLTADVPTLLEQNFVGSQPRRETLLSCSGNTRTTMIQLNAAMPDRLYETADAAYYVIGGEGAVRIAGRETKLATNGYVSVPRNTAHTFVRAGRRPLILLAVLSGEPCEEAK